MDNKKIIEGILEKCSGFLFRENGKKRALTPKEFECSVEAGLIKACEGTIFEGQVQADFGQKFPDITFQRGVYGVEVKFSKNEHFQTIGNSVLEGTRRDGIDEIYIIFGAFVGGKTPKFIWRKYEECCVDIAVTHYPRYKINMMAKQGESIFDKVKVPYSKLRKMDQEDILNVFRKYYKRQNASLWWLGRHEVDEDYVPAVFNFLSDLGKEEQRKILLEAFLYFPELVGNNHKKKYKGFVEWLLRKNVVCHNARDYFSSGGKVSRTIGSTKYKGLTKVVANICDELPEIKKTIMNADPKIIQNYWDLESTPKDFNWIAKEWSKRLLENLANRECNEAFLKASLENVFPFRNKQLKLA